MSTLLCTVQNVNTVVRVASAAVEHVSGVPPT